MSNVSVSSVSNESVNTTQLQIEEAPVSLTIVLMATSFWIVLVNGLVFGCLITSRSAMKSYVNLQLLSLSVTDMFVGLFSIPVTLTFKITGSFPKYDVCAGLFFLYISSQEATLYHALVICIHRLVTVKRKTRTIHSSTRSNYISVFLQVIFVWIVCFVLVSIPFLCFGRFGDPLVECSLNTLFEDHYTAALGMFTSVLLIPHVTLNVVYGYMFIFLRKRWKRIDAVCSTSTSHPIVLYNMRGNTSYSEAFTDIETRNTALMTPSNKIVSSGDGDQRKICEAPPKICFLEEKPVQNLQTDRLKARQQYISATSYSSNKDIDGGKTGDSQVKKNRKTGRLSGMEGQKRVLVTIGILLIILNIFMTPLDFLNLFEFLNKGYLSRRVKFICMNMGILNSALNPIISVFRIRPFKEILKQKALRLYRRLCR